MSIDMNAVVAGAMGVVTGIGSLVGFLIRAEKKYMPIITSIAYAVSGGKEAVEEATAVLQTDNPEERQAHIKAAAYCALRVLSVEVGALTDIQKAAVAKYIADSLPDNLKEYVTPTVVDSTLHLIQAEILAAQSHSGLQAAQALVTWLEESKPKTVEQVAQ